MNECKGKKDEGKGKRTLKKTQKYETIVTKYNLQKTMTNVSEPKEKYKFSSYQKFDLLSRHI